MSVVIKGVEAPISCNKCFCCDDDARFCMAKQEYIPTFGKPDWCPLEKPKWCPLVELPEKHGRLVDVNALKVALIHAGQASGRYQVGETWELNFEEILDVLVESPTIVEAEGEE